MTTTTCERAYQRGAGSAQVRTAGGRLIVSGQHVQGVERYLSGTRVLWVRERADRWHARPA